MLQSRSQRQNLNQENPLQKNQQIQQQQQQTNFPTKTPLRQQAGPSKGFLTGGKGLNNTVGRNVGGVLAVKDANKGRGIESIKLFTEKPSLGSTSGSCAPSFLSPLPAPRSTLPLHLLRTPAPSLVKPIHFLSPDEVIDDDIEEEEEVKGMEMDLEIDREVEYAGASPANFDQPFESEFPNSEFNFKNAGYGKMLRSLPILPVENYEEWALKDLEEIKATRFELDIEIINNPAKNKHDDSLKPIFPIPKRAPLASKSTNVSRPNSSASTHTRTSTFNIHNKPSFPLRTTLSSSNAATSTSSPSLIKPRTPLGSINSPRPQWGAGAGASPTVSRGGGGGGIRSTSSTPLGSSRLGNSSISSSTSTTGRLLPKKLLDSTTTTTSSSSTSSTSGNVIRSGKISTTTAAATTSSSSFNSLATLNEDLICSSSSISSRTSETKKMNSTTIPRLTREEEELTLGIFGITGGIELDSTLFGDESFAEVEEFTF